MSNLSGNKVTDAPVLFKKGTVIFAEGKASKYLYLVKKGQVSLMRFKGQNLNVIQVCGEKEILNEVSVLTNRPHEFSAIAKTDVELVLVEQKDVLAVIKNSPAWIPEIFETLCERLKLTQDMIEEHNLVSEKDPMLVLTKEDEKRYVQSLADFNSKE